MTSSAAMPGVRPGTCPWSFAVRLAYALSVPRIAAAPDPSGHGRGLTPDVAGRGVLSQGAA